MLKFKVLPIHFITKGVCSCSAGSACSSPGKHPIAARGSLSATNDPATIAEWQRRNPGCNWGIATGHDGLVVVDIDPRHGGHLSWVALIEKHGYPATLMVRTGSGGTHLYYRVPEGKDMLSNSTNRIAKGIDIRGKSGYVVAPPSNHLKGIYSWCEPKLDIAELPAWLYCMAKEKVYTITSKIQLIMDRIDLLFDGANEGERNEKAASVCGYYLRRLSELEALEQVLAWNTKNAPPLSDNEIQAVFKSIKKYH